MADPIYSCGGGVGQPLWFDTTGEFPLILLCSYHTDRSGGCGRRHRQVLLHLLVEMRLAQSSSNWDLLKNGTSRCIFPGFSPQLFMRLSTTTFTLHPPCCSFLPVLIVFHLGLFSSAYYSSLHRQPADNLQLLWAINKSSPTVFVHEGGIPSEPEWGRLGHNKEEEENKR